MIAKLSGVMDSAGEDFAVIDVGGVGYRTVCSARTLARLPPVGQPARLLIETVVREDAITLYGFAEPGERDWFRLLTTVQGVGARLAMAVLSALSPDQLAAAIAAQDRAVLGRASGVGPKLAARIVNELKDKAVAGTAGTRPLAEGTAEAGSVAAGALADAISALVNLGYGRAEAHGAVVRAAAGEAGPGADAATLVRAALREFGRSEAGA